MQKKYLEKGTLRHFRAIYEEYAAYLNCKKQHRNTLCCKTRVVRYFLGFLESHQSRTRNLRKLRLETIHEFLFTLRDFETSTYNNYLIYLRQFLTWLERNHQIAPMSWLLHSKPVEDSLPRNIPLFQMEQICTPAEQEAVLPPSRLALRNQAIVEVLFQHRGAQQRIAQYSGEASLCRPDRMHNCHAERRGQPYCVPRRRGRQCPKTLFTVRKR